MKSDGKSCHWKEYFLLGSENNLYLANNFVTHTIPVMGNVTATSTDYSTNTLFYATVSMNNGREEFSINSFQPKQNYKVLLSSEYQMIYILISAMLTFYNIKQIVTDADQLHRKLCATDNMKTLKHSTIKYTNEYFNHILFKNCIY